MRLLLFSLLLFLPLQASAEWYRETRDMMGTRVDVELWSENAEQAGIIIAEAMTALQRVDRTMNPLNSESELSRVNSRAFTAPVQVSEDIYKVVERALYYSRLSGGAFDISFASIGQFYDYRAGRAPSDELVAENRDRINFRAIVLDAEQRSIAFTIDGLQLDLGGDRAAPPWPAGRRAVW